METSFIPKKNYNQKINKNKYLGLFLTISIFIFVLAVISSSGVFFYKSYLESGIENKNIILERERDNLDLTLIQKLSKFDSKIEIATELLNKHTSLIYLFDFLEKNTLEEVMFNDFDFFLDKDGFNLSLRGKASNYTAVAIQSDILGKSEEVINPIFSNLGVDNFGDIVFEINMKIDPRLISYRGNLEIE